MNKSELNHLTRLHYEAEALAAVLVEKSSHADLGSDAAYRLNHLVDKASIAKCELCYILAQIEPVAQLG